MASIRVTPEELEGQGKVLVDLAQSEIADILSRVDSQVNLICDSWDGMAQDAFLVSYQEMKKVLDQFPLVVDGIGNQAIAAAKTFGQVDSELSSSFSGG